jgi:hypothetical protein
MNRVMFDALARRTASFLDQRSLLGGTSAALLAAGGVPLNVEAK